MNHILKALIVTAAALAAIALFPDVKRYIRISTM